MNYIRTEKDFWVEMAVRETWTQANFAELSYYNIDRKGNEGTDLVFSSIHSFLSHCANVSKMLKSSDKDRPSKSIGYALDIPENCIIHNRDFRNHLEHYDERLKKWIREKGVNANIGMYNIMPKNAVQIANMVYITNYDPIANTFTFVDEDLNLGELFTEVQKIKSIADAWVKGVEYRTILPPFISNELMSKEEIKEKIETELKKHEKFIRNKNAIEAFLGLLPPLDSLEKVLFGVQDALEIKRQALTLNMILDLIVGIDEKLSGKEPQTAPGLKILIENAVATGNITGLEGNTSNENMKKIFEKPLDVEIKNVQAQGNVTGVKLNVDGEMPVKGHAKIKMDAGTIEINPDLGEVTFGKDIQGKP